MDTHIDVPPGFRFHPTEEELVDYYLRKKMASNGHEIAVIKDVDLYRIEPWDLEDACKIAKDQDEWYFFSHKDRKYPTGTRTNRATAAGFWKATGRDKPIHSRNALVGMRKTLVFYKGRAPNGQKSDYIMHEFRLETSENAPVQEEGWVVCRVFKKQVPLKFQLEDRSYLFDLPLTPYGNEAEYLSRKTEAEFIQQLSDDFSPQRALCYSLTAGREDTHTRGSSRSLVYEDEEVVDWRILDKFVASQLTQDGSTSGEQNSLLQGSSSQEPVTDYPSSSASTSLIDLWK